MAAGLSRVLLVSIFIAVGSALYLPIADYSAASFFDNFDFFTDADPTKGFVQFQSQAAAQAQGLIRTYTGANITQSYMGVDSTSVAPNGRKSIRISSKAVFNHGLFILDLVHAPGGICGTWPAFWLLGSDPWPLNGEIDIVEGVNDNVNNAMTLHTTEGAELYASSWFDQTFSGTVQTSNCYVNAAGQPDNSGCSVTDDSGLSFGTGFNRVGGGVYATEWTSQAIKIWFFPRDRIPADILYGQPNPNSSAWGMPQSNFVGNFDIDNHFRDMKIIFDTTFCGTYAGAVFGQSKACAAKASSCTDFVANHPSEFVEAYWLVNSLKVYQNNGQPVTANITSNSTGHILAHRSNRHAHLHGSAPWWKELPNKRPGRFRP